MLNLSNTQNHSFTQTCHIMNDHNQCCLHYFVDQVTLWNVKVHEVRLENRSGAIHLYCESALPVPSIPAIYPYKKVYTLAGLRHANFNF